MAPHSRFLPAPRGATSPRTTAGAPVRLPWWAVVLPALAFAVLLAVVAQGGGHAEAVAASQPLTEIAGHLRGVLPPSLAGLL